MRTILKTRELIVMPMMLIGLEYANARAEVIINDCATTMYENSGLWSSFDAEPETVSRDTVSVRTDSISQMLFMEIDLNEVDVVAKKRSLSVRADKIVFKPDAFKGGADNVLDMIRSLPGVSVAGDGTISVNGRAGVMIMIDGRKQNLPVEQLANVLKTMQASGVESIDLTENGSVEYDADASGGVININRKMMKSHGQMVSLSGFYEMGKRERWQGSVNYSYGKERFSFYADMGYFDRKDFVDLDIDTHYSQNGKSSRQSTFRDYNNRGVFTQAGLDMRLSESTSAGIYSRYNESENRSDCNTNTDFFFSAGRDSLAVSLSDNSDRTRSNSSGLYLRMARKDKMELNVMAEYTFYDMSGSCSQESSFNNLTDRSMRAGMLRSSSESRFNLYSGQIDFTRHLSKILTFKAGMKGCHTNFHQSLPFYRSNNDVTEIDNEISSRMRYEEMIAAGYLMGEIRLGKFSINGGIRAEQTKVDGYQGEFTAKSDSSFRRNYVDYFPGATLQFNPGENHILALQYGSKITRPGFKQMSPYVTVFDDYLYETGNPNLKPQIINSLELSYVLKRSIRFCVYGTKGKDIINKSFESRENDRIYIIPANLAKAREYGVKVYASAFSPIKWLDVNLYGNFFRREYDFVADGINEVNNINTAIFHVQARLLLTGSLSVEIGASGYSDMAEGQMRVIGSNEMWCSINKSLKDGKGNISLYARDIFNTSHQSISTCFAGATARTREKTDKSYAGISVSWNFNSGIKFNKSSKPEGDTENKRINL